MNVADVAHDAGKVIDAVKMVDAAADVADAVKTADDVYPGCNKREKFYDEVKEWWESKK